MKTADMASENFEKLKALFPNCVTESLDKDGNPVRAIDKDLLMQEINSEVVEGQKERYQFNWPGKRDAIRKANAPTTMTLRPCKDESVDFDNTQNLYIEGDNLEVLKLLQNNYLGKVKMIYIDPPYNTGNDFVYNDNFKQDSETFLETSGMFDEDGNMTLQNYEKNSESNGRFHTDWLNMMYPRLKVARNLLSDDGVIFISIGDDEEANLIKIGDEIFGEKNFIASICHKHRGSMSNDRIISENHNHLVFYAKSMNVLFAQHLQIGDDPDLSGFNLEDDNGKYKLTPVDGPGGAKKGNPHYEFLGVEGYWRYSKETMQEKYNQGLIVRTKNGLQQKYYESKAALSRKTVSTWWDGDFLTSSATSELSKMMGGKIFDNPKNPNLIIRMLKMITHFDKDSLILDFFSGSATTAHAVMQLNAEDNGNRKFICVQLPEVTSEDSEAYKAGYKSICEIGKERIRRAGKKIKEESAEKAKDLDIGFRVLKLAESNMNDVYYKPADIDQGFLDKLDTNIKRDRTPMDLLFQVMLECDLELSSKIEEREINGKKVFFVNDKELVACFDENIDEATITEIAKLKPYYFVMRDSSLATDNVADNFEQLWNAYSKDTIRKVL